jgi:hypothetical protein
MNMEISTFLPKYPYIDTTDGIYDLYNGDTFNQVLYHKKEFNETTSSDGETGSNNFAHQKLIARFLDSRTLYDEILLYYFPGTGKTQTAINAIETIINRTENNIKRALILVNNENLLYQFQREIIFAKSTNGRYIPPADDEDDIGLPPHELQKKQFQRGKLLLRKNYTLNTHVAFFNQLQKLSQQKIKEDYSNMIVVIDEAHDIASSPLMYKTYLSFLHNIDNHKIILLTGTPMKNSADDIVPLMNLILPPELALAPLSYPLDEKYLADRFRGRISYLKSQANISYRYEGTLQLSSVVFPLFPSIMDPFQSRYYQLAYSNDTNTNVESSDGFYQHSLQASLFTFPDGSSGMVGYNAFVDASRNRFRARFLHPLARLSKTEKLAGIAQFSCKYATIIANIINNPDKNCFVYTTSIKGSGAIILGLCLELFGYGRVVQGGSYRPGKRYAILAESVGTDTKSVVETFNRRSNVDGKYIQVLIGGKKVEQGVSFYSVQSVHIATPLWNYSSLDQAVARVIRAQAHRFLEPNTLVHIYLHVAIPNNTDADASVDVKLYKMGQVKDNQIKQVEYIIKTNAWDCALLYRQNTGIPYPRDGDDEKNQLDETRRCEYRKCAYKCKDVDPFKGGEIIDTYQLYYDAYVEQIIQVLIHTFRKRFTIYLHELDEFDAYQIFHAIDIIQKRQVQCINKYGFQSYIKYDNDRFYLTSDFQPTSTFLTGYYTEFPMLHIQNDTFEHLRVQVRDEWIIAQIKHISSIPTPSVQQAAIVNLPLAVQSKFIELSIMNKWNGQTSPLVEWVLQHYAAYIHETPSSVTLNFTEPLVLTDQGWEPASEEKGDLYLNPMGVYGYYKGKAKRFTVVDLRDVPLSKRKHESGKRGRKCESFAKVELIQLFQHLKVPLGGSELTVDQSKQVLRDAKMLTDEMTDSDIQYYAYWANHTITDMCETLEKWMKQIELI